MIKLPPGRPAGIAVAGGSVWVAAGGDGVARIDAVTGRVRAIVPTGLPVGLAAAAGAVLVTEPEAVGGALECIRPGATPSGMPLEPALGELAFGGGAVWVADRRGSLVYRLDPDRLPC
ncbi:MAG TPA: hypothetical protein VID07_00635 [Actinomycetes bacterium]